MSACDPNPYDDSLSEIEAAAAPLPILETDALHSPIGLDMQILPCRGTMHRYPELELVFKCRCCLERALQTLTPLSPDVVRFGSCESFAEARFSRQVRLLLSYLVEWQPHEKTLSDAITSAVLERNPADVAESLQSLLTEFLEYGVMFDQATDDIRELIERYQRPGDSFVLSCAFCCCCCEPPPPTVTGG